MAGRIRDQDIAEVRERSPIAEVVGQYLALRPAGGGELKGLCPFHEERTPSFHVAPERGYYHCFGCGAGGDVITFVQEVEHLSFAEAVESLARRAHYELQYEQGGAAPGRQSGIRQRLLDAHADAAVFYREQLVTPAARGAREFLASRGFDEAAAQSFGVGYSPDSWDALLRHLVGRGYTTDELATGGLVSQGRRGPVDRFRGRLMWPVRDVKGDVIGFGARRLGDDADGTDRGGAAGPKYLNSPDTPLYHKSSVLYGIDLAKGEIARRMQAVVVEGYTDVMACHLAGVPTAVATCGTAFGVEHIAVLRRLLMDQDEFRGRVIFTFDGDEAGRRAALRAFADDQRFVTQTFVAVERSGLDPCDLRLQKGDLAVRDLVANHVPLAEFAIRSVLERYDLELPEGRVGALDAAAPMVSGIRDWALRAEYGRRLAGWLGMDVDSVLARVRDGDARASERRGRPGSGSAGSGSAGSGSAAGGRAAAGARGSGAPGQARGGGAASAQRPAADSPELLVERETLKVALQRPALAGPVFDALDAAVFTAGRYAAVRDAIAAAGGTADAPGGTAWVDAVRAHAGDEGTRGTVVELAVEPLRTLDTDAARYAASLLARLREMAVTRRIQQLKSRLQRLNAVEEQEEFNRLFGDIIALERQKAGLREQAIGAL